MAQMLIRPPNADLLQKYNQQRLCHWLGVGRCWKTSSKDQSVLASKWLKLQALMLLRCGEERGHSSAAWKNVTGTSQKGVRALLWSLQKVA